MAASIEHGNTKIQAGINVADIGCGHGHSTVLMAEAFPISRFWGFDTHEESIHAAREIAREAGVNDRVKFEVYDATSYPNNKYELVFFSTVSTIWEVRMMRQFMPARHWPMTVQLCW